jgi:hypothetical protein
MRNRKNKPPIAARILKLFRNKKDPYGIIVGSRSLVSSSEYSDFIRGFVFFGSRSLDYTLSRRPTSVANIRKDFRLLSPISLKAELLWFAEYICLHAKFLSEFIVEAQTLNLALLTADADECVKQLDYIEHTFGFSFWSIEARLALLQLSKGLEAQKAYLTQIYTESQNSTVSFVAFFLSERNEETTNPLSFKKSMLESIPLWSPNPEFKAYVTYRLADEWANEPKSVSLILRWEFTSPIVDYYETFVRLATKAITERSQLGCEFVQALKQISSVIADPRLRALIFLATDDIKYIEDLPLQDHAAFDHIANGDLRSALGFLIRPEFAVDPEAIFARVAAVVDSGEGKMEFDGTLRSKVCDLGVRIAAKSPGYEDAYVELLRFATNFKAGVSRPVQPYLPNMK